MRHPFGRSLHDIREARKTRVENQQLRSRDLRVKRRRLNLSRQAYIDQYENIHNDRLTVAEKRSSIEALNRLWQAYVSREEVKDYERLASESCVSKKIHRYRAEQNVIRWRLETIGKIRDLDQRIASLRDFNRELRASNCLDPTNSLPLQLDLSHLDVLFQHPGLTGRPHHLPQRTSLGTGRLVDEALRGAATGAGVNPAQERALRHTLIPAPVLRRN